MKVPWYARIFDGSIGFEPKRGIVPGLYEFFISLRPQHYQQGVHKDRRGNKLLNIAEVILNTKENRSLWTACETKFGISIMHACSLSFQKSTLSFSNAVREEAAITGRQTIAWTNTKVPNILCTRWLPFQGTLIQKEMMRPIKSEQWLPTNDIFSIQSQSSWKSLNTEWN